MTETKTNAGPPMVASLSMASAVPDRPIEITGGVVIHVGPMNGGVNPRDYKAKGYKLHWVLTREELKANVPLADEGTFVWESDNQLRRVLHDQIHQWVGGLILPDGERQEKVAAIMADLASLHSFNEASNKILSQDDLPTRNAIRNYHWFEDGIPLSRIRGAAKGHAVVIIAAGPSLNDQWPYLRKLRETMKETIFIVCGRSYKKAMQEGISPEFVMEVEQYDWDAELFMFAPPPEKHSVLAFPATAAPRLAKVWPSEKLCLLNHNLAVLMGLKPGTDSINGGNSVLHYAFTLADIMGAGPIYLAGVDFGYPKGRDEDTHAAGTFHPWGTDNIRVEHTHQDGLMVEANDGQPLMSSMPYKNFGTYLAVQIEYAKMKQPDIRVYSFSKRGMKVPGVEYKDIGELAEEAAKGATT